MKRLVFILPLLLFCAASSAQIQFGYISYEQVLKELPEYAKATQDIAALKAKYEEEAKKGMDSSQVTGAASSYARKYALNGLFCIDDNKDSDATNTHGKETQESADNMRFTCEECGKPLTSYIGSDGKTVAIRKHAEGSKKKFGKVLCLDCIGKLNES